MRTISDLRNQTGSAKSILLLLLVVICIYAAIKLAKPYYGYKDLEGTMEYWAKIALHQGDANYSELKDKMAWVIEEHDIPLDIHEIQITYGPHPKSLTVSAEYDVFVEFPGYEHHFHFEPYAYVTSDEP
jgi:hypothetical protein